MSFSFNLQYWSLHSSLLPFDLTFYGEGKESKRKKKKVVHFFESSFLFQKMIVVLTVVQQTSFGSAESAGWRDPS